MTGFKTTKVELVATFGGYLWMPRCEAWKATKETVTREGKPFTYEWPGTMRGLLLMLDTREGRDFSSRSFIEADLVVTRRSGSVTRTRCVDLRSWPDCADLFHSEEAGLAILDACCPDEE